MEAFNELYWKHRDNKSALVIATHGHQFIPAELFGAMDIDFVDIIIGGNETWQTRGIDYLNPTACVYARQIIGLFESLASGIDGFPKIEFLLNTNFCSGDYHSGEIIARYFGARTINFLMPYKLSKQSFNLFVENIKELIQILENEGFSYQPEKLWHEIEYSNEIKELYKMYARLAVVGPERLNDFYEIELAPWKERKRVLVSLLEKHGNMSKQNKVNIVLTGSPVMVGDKFCTILESIDLPVRIMDFHFADQHVFKEIPKDASSFPVLGKHVDFSNPIHVVAAYYLEKLAPERLVGNLVTHLDSRIKQVMKYKAFLGNGDNIDGIINHVLKFCDVYGTDRSEMKSRLQEQHGIPVLDIERDFSASSSGQILTRGEAFKEMLWHRKFGGVR
nr:2-hydroxyacyl-CoA dehydratase family protein [Candidatus Sigynarchaeota archaeon]